MPTIGEKCRLGVTIQLDLAGLARNRDRRVVSLRRK
jgi:hypothetical protein